MPQHSAEPVAGRVLLANGEEMACTALMRSPLLGEIRVQARGLPGEIVVCALDNIGILAGRVTAALPDGFSVAFMVKASRRDKVAARLEWHDVQADRVARLRGAARIVPIHRAVTVRVTGTLVLDGILLNISMSGAAITLRPDPGLFVGTLVRVGTRMATVVRAITDGIAVQFVEPFAPHNFDERIRP